MKSPETIGFNIIYMNESLKTLFGYFLRVLTGF